MTDKPTDSPLGPSADEPLGPSADEPIGPPAGESTDRLSFEDEPGDAPPTPAPPAPPPPGAAPRRLVRDPYSRLGGVASGVAHYYGFDVSIVRIVFLLFAFATGFGFLAYLLAWLIIPRADHWPPGGVAPRPFRSLRGRDLGLGLVGIGLLLALAFGGGVTGSILVPLILVGGGVWLLIQPSSDDAPVDDRDLAVAGVSPAAGAPTAFASPPGPAVPPRSRGRRAFVAVIVTAFVLLVVLPALVIGGIIIGLVTGNVSFDAETVSFTPDSVTELPIDVTLDAADVTVDLTGLEPSDFAGVDDPLEIDLNVDFGQVNVIVPEDIPVSVDAEASVGEIELFDQIVSGIGNQATTSIGDPVVDILIDMGVGDVNVVRP